jgi:tripartite-type tricarboxylate transporter receptor subunit TctC
MFFGDMQILLPHVGSGTLRALAIGHSERVKQLPDVPTLSESGLPGAVADNWYGIVVPVATPPAVFEKLRDAIVSSVKDPLTQSRLAGAGAVLVGNSPAEFAAYIEAETKKWAEIVRLSGAKLE